ncbi:hypothetical protein EU528_08160 [Candidatus Thorarchaeota archaeon]|nr:MAG: hypothetical protein EU528_08160 [Candidatus Thorarchaeota archaeon]
MTDLEILRTAFVALIDGFWWGLRENTGPLSMYEGYSSGFKQMGEEIAEKSGGKGPEDAAKIAGKLFEALGLEVSVQVKTIMVKKCPFLDRILERGLEFAFHLEEICWMPMLEGIGEKVGATPEMITALRLIHIERAKVDYKKGKTKMALDSGKITEKEYDKEIAKLDQSLKVIPKFGQYVFK